MTILMRDGTAVQDERLGRLVQFDEESRNYPVRALLPTTGLRGRTWGLNIWLDQGQTSACVGNSRTYDLAASPKPIKKPDGTPLDEDFAQALYNLAKKYDEWPGEAYEGSSVLGGCKASQALGFIGEYRWAFGIDDMLAALAHLGPVVVGTNWLNGMFDPQPNGLVRINMSDSVAGGHAYQARGVIVSDSYKSELLGKGQNRKGVPLIRWRNSWGKSWGVNGEFFTWADEFEALLKADGEAAVTTVAFHR